MVRKCPLVLDGLVACAYMNVLPLGSYDILIGMDWLEAQRAKIDCYNKSFECLDEGKLKVVKGIPKVTSGRHSSVNYVLWERLQGVSNSCFGGNRK